MLSVRCAYDFFLCVLSFFPKKFNLWCGIIFKNAAKGTQKMARKIVITSGKGGVGKTTVCCNLGVQLARLGYRVIIADLDFGLNNVDVVLGLEHKAIYDVSDAVEGRCRARQVLNSHPEYPTLFSVSSNRVPDRYVSPQAVRLVLDTLSPQYDFILIDSPAGIDEGFHRAVSCAEEGLLITTPHISAMRDADRVAGMLKSYRLNSVGLVVNLVRKDMARRGEILTPQEISEIIRLPLAAVVLEEDKLYLNNIFKRSRAFRALAECVIEGKRNEDEKKRFRR